MIASTRTIHTFITGLAIILLALLLAACSDDNSGSDEPTATAVGDLAATATQEAPAQTGSTGQGAIDNRSLAVPARDTIFSCNADALGAALDRPWVDGQGVIDFDAKPVVEGAVTWDGELDVSEGAAERTISSNGLPDHPTGDFPAVSTSEAYEYDRNPNAISVQDLIFAIPVEPIVAGEPGCLQMGPIAIALTGAVVFNALDAETRDAVANEVFDDCQGHPAQGGIYHYHHYSPCFDRGAADQHSPLVAYALDGFGIYGPHDADGALIMNAELDECHGHAGPVPSDGGSAVDAYHYHATEEFPYTLGCYRGERN